MQACGSPGNRDPGVRRREVAQRSIELANANHADETIAKHESASSLEVRILDHLQRLSWRRFLHEHEYVHHDQYAEH